ncbi:MAG: efflux transporter periplasmic adaptor subunit, partial [Pseudomonadota bacterium]
QRPFKIALSQAQAALDEALAGLELQKNEVKRARPLIERRTIPQSEFESRLAQKLQAEARVASAKARLNEAQLNLEWTEIKAPISGRISDARTDVGNLISGGQADATVLTKIVSLNPINFVFFGSEADFLNIHDLQIQDNAHLHATKQIPLL